MIKTLQFITEEISCKYNINFSEAQKIVAYSFLPKILKEMPDYVQHYDAEYWADEIMKDKDMINMAYDKSDLWIIEQMYKTINFMASDLSDSDLNCYYCSHFPEGGDGQCTIYINGSCQFKWRYADKAEKIIEKIKNEEEQNNEK